MVFFCCNGCGETLKKQKVEQHPASCRSTVSCIDCNMNFVGYEYKKHTQCVSEAQRYQGNLYQAKENKGALKQNSWMESVRSAAENCKNNAQLKGLLVRIADNDNVPRKKAKFLNFIKNSMRVGNKDLVEKAWEAIEIAGKPKSDPTPVQKSPGVDETTSQQKTLKKKKKDKPEADVLNIDVSKIDLSKSDEASKNSDNNSQDDINKNHAKKSKKRKRVKSNSETPNVAVTKKKKKSKNKENETVENTSLILPNLNHVNGIAPETPGKAQKYKISNHIQELVFAKGDISLKKLKRKVTSAYLEYNPHKSVEDASKLFDKKVMKVPGVAVEHGTATKEVLDVIES